MPMSTGSTGPVERMLEDVHRAAPALDSGTVADCIPEPAKADPATFALSLAPGVAGCSRRGIPVRRGVRRTGIPPRSLPRPAHSPVPTPAPRTDHRPPDDPEDP
jgi:hypothetical protein